MGQIYRCDFVFQANRYEEWQAGRCISQGATSTKIVAEVRGDEIYFTLEGADGIRVLKSFEFCILDEDFCVLPDRIQYVKACMSDNSITPMVCHIFYQGEVMQYVRFAMTNPDRIVEFYGTQVSKSVAQDSSSQDNGLSDSGATTAELPRGLLSSIGYWLKKKF